jgi:glycosyltransferase involved in cell wall biosynthesis
MITVSLCIATHRRPEKLSELLQDLTQQGRVPDEVIIVDNDPAATAQPVVANRIQMGAPFPIRYEIQPQKNISLTRNRTVALASGEWLAFIDDDERAPASWLAQMLAAAARYNADGILGPVDPVVPQTAPAWIRRGRFYEFPRMPTGTVIPPNRLRFGNVLLRGSLIRAMPQPFDPALGLTGGEDGDLLSRLVLQGARIIWCDEAIVNEPVEPARLSLRWLLRRALSGGQDLARHALAGRYGEMSALGRSRFFLRALLQALAAAALALVSLPIGRHLAAYWLTKLSANLGKLSVFWGWRYREYA